MVIIRDQFCVYKIKNKINGKVYIGKTNNFNKRMINHKSTNKTAIGKAINKYGMDNFDCKKIIDNISSAEANRLEKYYINEVYNTFKGEGYNCSAGGETSPMFGKQHSTKTKIKISKSLQGDKHPLHNKKLSEEHKRAISKSQSGNKNPMYNKSFSKEHKDKLSKSKIGKNNGMYGKKHSKETREKISKKHQGKKISEAHKNKISNSLKNSKEKRQKKNSKFGKGKYVEIYNFYQQNNVTQKCVAAKYNLGTSTVNRIVNKNHWATKEL